MTPAPLRGLEGQSLPAFGLQPSGMLRIRLGQQERYIWPVHLPGWLAAGWRVAGSDAVAATEPMFADPVDVAVPGASTSLFSAANPTPPPELPEPAASADATPALTRGRRGRRRKEESAPADPEPAVVIPQESTPSDQLFADSDTARDGADSVPGESVFDRSAGDPAEHSSGSSTEVALAVDPDPAPEPEPVLTALPDDLFDDPLT